MKLAKLLILIPARYESTRFPGKPLANIKNKKMIDYVIMHMKEVKGPFEVVIKIVTNSQLIEDYLNENYPGENLCVRVDDDVISGSERIYLAFTRFFSHTHWDLIINVQGDEPLLSAKSVENLASTHLKQIKDWGIATLVIKKSQSTDQLDFINPDKVKAVVSEVNNHALYFSRASIPFMRDEKSYWHLHVGVYSFTVSALKDFAEFKGVSRLEHAEKLEQLRALEMGIKIGAIETDDQLCGVDRPEDIIIVEKLL